ncbi:DUF4396 domain-containing protein [Amycolatopsis sp. lyj-108]|uniref:DUF4396 domain-containing protein n=1 Tax=Amycolatopsis sp. lyj-108 TaxID=2789286 RepID=UPI003978B56B
MAYAVRVLAEPSSLGDEDIAELREHGWSDQIIADTVGLVSLNLLTGSFNLVAGLEPGCAIGEVLGMVIGTALGWGNVATIVLAVALAFVFLLTTPVNKWLIGRGSGHAVVHAYHH